MSSEPDVTTVQVPALEQIAARGQLWTLVAKKYGVSNPVPPWKSSLDGMCEALDREGTALQLTARRNDEDRLAAERYRSLPFPENQLIALAHSLIARNVIDEAELAARMDAVRKRLQNA
jgi:hypothetical protein